MRSPRSRRALARAVCHFPGCVAVGDTREQFERDIRTALAMHLQGMLNGHDPIPPVTSSAEVIEVSLPHPVA